MANVFRVSTAVTAAVAALLLWVPLRAAADDQDAAAPITIDRCTMSEDPVVQDPERAGPRSSKVDGLTIAYSNERDVAATEIGFRADYRGRVFNLVDRGMFAPHVKFSRKFTSFNATFAGSSADCSVTSVTFTDGSHWSVPTPAASPEPTR